MSIGITTRMNNVKSDLDSTLLNIYSINDFEAAYKELCEAKPSQKIFLRKKLVNMFKAVGIDVDYNGTCEYYHEQIKCLYDNPDIPSEPKELSKKLIKTLFNIYSKFPNSSDFMLRIVDSLAPEVNSIDSLRLRILKRFIDKLNIKVKSDKKQINTYYSAPLAAYVEKNGIDESIFDKVNINSEDYKLVRAADYLAKGLSIYSGTTKEYLFLFAFAYGMRYYESEKDIGYCSEKDVNKNLFVDFYCDNLTRYFEIENISGNVQDKEPSGEGLNPKNFVDVAFIWFLNNDDIETPAEKLSGFCDMLTEVKRSWNESHPEYGEEYKTKVETDVPTTKFRERLTEVLNIKDKAELKNYLLNNYYCDVRQKIQKIQALEFFQNMIPLTTPYNQDNVYSKFSNSSDFMLRIVDSLAPEVNSVGSLRLRILKRFIDKLNIKVKSDKKQINTYYSAPLAAYVEKNGIDESIFDKVKINTKHFKLVRAADYLAKGLSIHPENTKEYLFLFAFAYGMRYYESEKDVGYCSKNDVNKNLFVDYYCDYVKRYFEIENISGSVQDRVPSGEGLNLKNFVDVAFIYYLNNNNDDIKTPAEKLSYFYNMLTKVEDSWNKSHPEYDEALKTQIETNFSTAKFSRERLAEALNIKIKSKAEVKDKADADAELKNYLLNNYYCDLREKIQKIQTIGIFQHRMSLQTPFKQYWDILGEIFGEKKIPASVKDFKGIKHELLYLNISDLNKEYIESLFKEDKAFDKESLERFLRIIEQVAKRLDIEHSLFLRDAAGMTRTKLIAAYYHHYCNYYCNNDADKNKPSSFADVCYDFYDVNSYLSEAGYQEINTKNIFDMTVIFYAYCKLNNILDGEERLNRVVLN